MQRNKLNALLEKINSLGFGSHSWTSNAGGYFFYREDRLILQTTTEDRLYGGMYGYLMGCLMLK